MQKELDTRFALFFLFLTVSNRGQHNVFLAVLCEGQFLSPVKFLKSLWFMLHSSRGSRVLVSYFMSFFMVVEDKVQCFTQRIV